MAPFFKDTAPSGTHLVLSQLGRQFGAPPFSILDSRIKWWMERKRVWRSLGIRGETGRATKEGRGKFLEYDLMRQKTYSKAKQGGPVKHRTHHREQYDLDGYSTSVFDPVLAELMCRWFCPSGGVVLDPFAGESTKGLVASSLGYQYLGVELRQEQIDVNRQQAERLGLNPVWVCGDSMNIRKLVPHGLMADLIFTSPPYYDLEVYSSAESDGSTKQTYEEFLDWYTRIFRRSVALLREDRFVVVKVGEIRDKATGIYRNFVGDNIHLFTNMGLHYYNEMILITAVGSMPVRVGRWFRAMRKVGKIHQNVLCFFKGDPKHIKEVFRGAV